MASRSKLCIALHPNFSIYPDDYCNNKEIIKDIIFALRPMNTRDVSKDTEIALLVESVKQLQTLVVALTQEFKDMQKAIIQVEKEQGIELAQLEERFELELAKLKDELHEQALENLSTKTLVKILIGILTPLGTALAIALITIGVQTVYRPAAKAEESKPKLEATRVEMAK